MGWLAKLKQRNTALLSCCIAVWKHLYFVSPKGIFSELAQTFQYITWQEIIGCDFQTITEELQAGLLHNESTQICHYVVELTDIVKPIPIHILLQEFISNQNQYWFQYLYQTDTDKGFKIPIIPIPIKLYLFETDISVWYWYISVYTNIIPLYRFETNTNIDFRLYNKPIPILSSEYI